MADVITGPEVKEFNPATLVYKNDDGDKVLSLDAKLAWFHWLKPGWRITIDGLRVFGMEVYVNNTYEVPNKPGEQFSRREKEIVYQAVGFISMLDANSVRVASVPMNIDASDPDFCGKLFEDGAEFLLDFCGFNVYNITKAQWEAAMEERLSANRNRVSPSVNNIPPRSSEVSVYDNASDSDYNSDNFEAPQADSQKQQQFFENLIPNQPPAAVDSPVETDPFNFHEAFTGMPHANVVASEPEDGDELSIGNMLKLYNQYNQTLPKPLPESELQNGFERYCIFLKGLIYTEMDANDQYEVLNDLKKMIADSKNK